MPYKKRLNLAHFHCLLKRNLKAYSQLSPNEVHLGLYYITNNTKIVIFGTKLTEHIGVNPTWSTGRK